MSQILTLEISEQTFVAIKQKAEESGVAPAYLAALLLEQKFTDTSEASEKPTKGIADQEEFESYFGSLSIENGLSVDNESIDADLAREYSSSLESGTCF